MDKRKDKRRREDDILWAGEPKRRLLGGGWLTVWPNEVGLVMLDGKLEYTFTERQDKLPKGNVRTYVASTAEFTLSFWLNDPSDPSPPSEGVALDLPVFAADGQPATGHIDLTLSVDGDNAHYLLPLLGQRGAVGAEEMGKRSRRMCRRRWRFCRGRRSPTCAATQRSAMR